MTKENSIGQVEVKCPLFIKDKDGGCKHDNHTSYACLLDNCCNDGIITATLMEAERKRIEDSLKKAVEIEVMSWQNITEVMKIHMAIRVSRAITKAFAESEQSK